MDKKAFNTWKTKTVIKNNELKKVFVCPNCNKEVTEISDYCPNCGEHLNNMRIFSLDTESTEENIPENFDEIKQDFIELQKYRIPRTPEIIRALRKFEPDKLDCEGLEIKVCPNCRSLLHEIANRDVYYCAICGQAIKG